MGIDSVGGYPAAKAAYGTQNKKGAVEQMDEKLNEAAGKAKKSRQDGFVRQSARNIDTDQLRAMKKGMLRNVEAFQKMVTGTAIDQVGELQKKFKEIFANGDDSVKLIGEDKLWGIEATAGRLLDFAKRLSGDDPEKADELMRAVEDGFEAARKTLGGLPEVSQKTLERTRELFAEWKDSRNVNRAASEG